jgi:hypothetical protein
MSIEQYLVEYEQLSPEVQVLHNRVMLRYLAELLQARAEGRPARLDLESLLQGIDM